MFPRGFLFIDNYVSDEAAVILVYPTPNNIRSIAKARTDVCIMVTSTRDI